MSEQDTGAETTISEEELEEDLTPSGEETLDELQQKLANAEKAKKQILARARKAEEKLKEYKPAETPKAKAEEPSVDDKVWEVAEMIRQGYTRADAEFIQKNGGSEAMQDPNSYVSVAMRTLQEQRKAEQASHGTETSTSGLSQIERKYTPEQLKNMSIEELEKILPRAEPT